MPSGDIHLDITGENKDLIRKLVQSEKKVERLERRLSKTGQSGAKSFGRVGREVLALTGALVGVNGITGAISKVVDEARQALQKIRDMQKDAARSQMSFSDAVGRFIGNNPTIDDGERQTWVDFAKEQGAQLGAGGMTDVMRSLTDLRSSTAGASQEQQLAAMQEAVKRKLLDPDTDLASFSQAILKMSQSTGTDVTKASNLFSVYGERAGGDVAGLAAQGGKIKAVADVTGENIADVAALHAFRTTELADATGEESSTVISNLLTRIASRDIKIGGRVVKTEAEGEVDKLVEIVKRIEEGEFGDNKTKAYSEMTQSLGREAASAVQTLAVLGKEMNRFQETRKLTREGLLQEGSLLDRQLADKAALAPNEARRRSAKAAAGTAEAAELGDIGGGAVATAEEELGQFDKRFGLTGFMDIDRVVNRWRADRTLSSTEYKRTEKLRRIRRAVARRTDEATGEGAVGAYNPVSEMESVQDILRYGAAHGGVDLGTRLDRLEKEMLLAAGIPKEQLTELEQTFERGMKQAFRESLSELLTEIRSQTSSTNRQELD